MNAYPVLDLCKGNRSFYSLTLIDRLTARTKSLAGVRLAAFDRCPLSRRGSRDRGRGRLYLAVAGVRLAAFDRCALNGLRSRFRHWLSVCLVYRKNNCKYPHNQKYEQQVKWTLHFNFPPSHLFLSSSIN